MATDEEIRTEAREYIERYTKSMHSVTLFDKAINSAIKKGIEIERKEKGDE